MFAPETTPVFIALPTGIPSRLFPATFELGAMKRPPFALGRIGSALLLQGPSARAYARAPDYPKTTNNQLSAVAWVRAEPRPCWAAIAKNWVARKTGQFHLGLRDNVTNHFTSKTVLPFP